MPRIRNLICTSAMAILAVSPDYASGGGHPTGTGSKISGSNTAHDLSFSKPKQAAAVAADPPAHTPADPPAKVQQAIIVSPAAIADEASLQVSFNQGLAFAARGSTFVEAFTFHRAVELAPLIQTYNAGGLTDPAFQAADKASYADSISFATTATTTGIPGPQGPKGDTGATGATGAMGAPGKNATEAVTGAGTLRATTIGTPNAGIFAFGTTATAPTPTTITLTPGATGPVTGSGPPLSFSVSGGEAISVTGPAATGSTLTIQNPAP